MFFVFDSIICSLTGLSWISPSRNAILAVGTCAARRLAVREELDKSPCRRCVWNHFGITALQCPKRPPSMPWQLSLELFPPLEGAPRKGKSLCVLLPLLAPSHPVLVTKPISWKPKRAQISVKDETPRKKKHAVERAWHGWSHTWFAAAFGCWSGSLN